MKKVNNNVINNVNIEKWDKLKRMEKNPLTVKALIHFQTIKT